MLTTQKSAKEALNLIMQDEEIADSLPTSIRKKINIWYSLSNDSDEVTDLGPSTKFKKHTIVPVSKTSGKVSLYCPKTSHIYMHVINVPCKTSLICRGCGEEIHS